MNKQKTIKQILNENGLTGARVYKNNSYYDPIETVYKSGYTRGKNTIYFYGIDDYEFTLKIVEELNKNGHNAMIGDPNEIILKNELAG